MRKIVVSLSAGLSFFGAFGGSAIADPIPAPAFAFPVVQCSFDIYFMNTEKNIAITRQCPHLADKTQYVVTFSNILVRADDAVSAGSFAVKTGNEKITDMSKGAQVTFKIPPPGSGSTFTWTAPGSIIREDTIQNPGPGAVAVIQFVDVGCGGANCAISGTVTIRAKDP